MRKVPRLIYIMGTSRTGSTILDAVLGSDPAFAATGELNQLLFDDVDVPRVCACGQPLEACEFWQAVLGRWAEDLAPGTVADYIRLQDLFERFRALPRLEWASERRLPSFEAYTTATADLLSRIAAVDSAEYVADSSKNPVRAWAILRGGRVEVSLIHLVRDPRAVAWSKAKLLRWRGLPRWLRGPTAVVLRSAIDWNVANAASERIPGLRPDVPYIRVRYEDLAEHPALVLRRIGSALDLKLGSLADRAAAGEAFSFSHIMAGNLVRRRPPRPLAKDDEWRTKAPAWIRWISWTLCQPLARRYGYSP